MELKRTAINYIKSDISALSEQLGAGEISFYIARIRGAIGVLLYTKILSQEDAENLEGEMGEARSIATKNIAKLT